MHATRFLAALLFLRAARGQEDDLPECEDWAAAGQCTTKPDIMREHCPRACAARAKLERKLARKGGVVVGDDDDDVDDDGGGGGGAHAGVAADDDDDDAWHADYDYSQGEL